MKCSLPLCLEEVTYVIFLIRKLNQKQLFENKSLFLAFVDLEKTFDHMQGSVIWQLLRKPGEDEWLMTVVQTIYKDAARKVRAGNEFSLKVGVHQGPSRHRR